MHGEVHELVGYRPYFNIQENMFQYNPPEKFFHMGRLSRDDGGKFSSDMWNIFYKVCSPVPTKTFIMGWGENALAKCGKPPAGLDWLTGCANYIPVIDFYHHLHCIIHKTGGSRESYCRIVPEAYAHGVPIIVEKDYAFPELIVDGVTGFMCESSDEMSYRASQLAFNEDLRHKIIDNARLFLTSHIVNDELCWAPWKQLLADV
jgi:glycosyltransferase involved in cell wall biosynthesis